MLTSGNLIRETLTGQFSVKYVIVRKPWLGDRGGKLKIAKRDLSLESERRGVCRLVTAYKIQGGNCHCDNSHLRTLYRAM